VSGLPVSLWRSFPQASGLGPASLMAKREVGLFSSSLWGLHLWRTASGREVVPSSLFLLGCLGLLFESCDLFLWRCVTLDMKTDMKNRLPFALACSVFACFIGFAPSSFAAPVPDEGLRREIRESHKRLHELMKQEDQKLEQAIAAMNAAPADRKVDAIVAVLNQMWEERKLLREERERLRAKMRGLWHGNRGAVPQAPPAQPEAVPPSQEP
jgi:hypothetical protein